MFINIFFLFLLCFGWVFAIVFYQKYSSYKDIKQTLQQHCIDQQQQLQNLQANHLEKQQTFNNLQQDNITKNMQDVRSQLQTSLKQHGDSLDKPLSSLTMLIKQQLESIALQVNQRLDTGFDKTNAVFKDIVARLHQIDKAQEKIQSLTTHVVDLKTLLSDKKSRGAFGEVQLHNLIKNVMPKQHFALQHTLSNGKRPDCLLFLPKPTGNIAIDAKFPLEAFQTLQSTADDNQIKQLHKQFKQDLLIHINAIASKYIIKNETASGAIMFIPAEAIFAHIHSYYPEVVSFAQQAKVWLASPSTMMAILTTATSVLKDIETQQQVHEIQVHIGHLNQDFQRFKKRVGQLHKHIQQVNSDFDQVNTSANKITKRFESIEQVDLKMDGIEAVTE